MTKEQLDRAWEVVNRVIDDPFGKTLVVGIPIEEKQYFAERVVREIGAIGIEPQAPQPRSLRNSLRSVRLSRMPRSLSLCELTATFLIIFKEPGRAGRTASMRHCER
jgi:hypothetical protein